MCILNRWSCGCRGVRTQFRKKTRKSTENNGQCLKGFQALKMIN